MSNGFGAELVPFDNFWEQPLQEMNIKWATTNFSSGNLPMSSHDFLSSHQVFANMTDFKKVATFDIGVGLLPKSIIQLGNHDIVLGTFSAKQKYTFKIFTAYPF